VLSVAAVALDCLRLDEQVRFWCAALGNDVVERWEDAHGAAYVEIGLPGMPGAVLLLQAVDDVGSGKNRVHLDLRAPADQEQEVSRLVDLGAAVLGDDPAVPWVVLADPEGNEFCVLPPES
jgi:catechol 2,3-dioxygenase-like lactoylglutathione lyase family enzyme